LKNRFRFLGLVVLITVAFVTVSRSAQGQVPDTLDGFKTLVQEASTNAASLKRCTDELATEVNSLATDKLLAGNVFKAIQSGDSAGLQALLARQTPSCTVQVSGLEKDFKFQLILGNPATGNHVELCFVSRNHPSKCPDGTRFDIDLVIR
jgi:hypothetical protein